jgi:DNA polymerase-3 subunit delta'
MPTLLSTVRAQTPAVETLRRALAGGRVHHAYLFDGPDGVGKERAALGLAQALVCERRPAGSWEACGACRACIRAVPRPGEKTPVHPDVVLLERGLYEPATLGRRTPETQDISIDQVRTLVLARAAFPPHEGKARIFVVRRAEELSTSAANALLKTLEEPGALTYFVLLSATPDALLPTIRSRTLRVRFGPLPDAVVADLLAEEGMARPQAEAIAALSGGSMTTARTLGDPQAAQERQEFVERALAAIDARGTVDALALAEDAKKIAKDALVVRIHAFAAAIAAEGRRSAREPESKADVIAARYSLALAAVTQIESNASVQLALESMFIKMRSLSTPA